MPAPSPAKNAPAAPPPKKSKKWLWIAIAAVVVLGGGGAAAFFMLRGHAPKDAEHAEVKAGPPAKLPAQYYALEEPFVVNLADEEDTRYLQANVQLVTRDPPTLAAFESQKPAIRNRLLLLFSQQSAGGVAQRSGKERLQAAALKEVKDTLKDEGQPDKVEAVIFTSLVTQ